MDLIGANLARTNMAEVDLAGKDLTRANLQQANLVGALLTNASLGRANLAGANLENANLEGAHLKSANLRNANLKGANLKGAYLIWTDCRGANLENANLEGALLENARLENSNLSNAKMTQVFYNETTCWPDDFHPSNTVLVMNSKDVETLDDLLGFLWQLKKSQAVDFAGSLQEYLQAFLGIIRLHQYDDVSPNLAAQLFEAAFSEEPVPFDDSWIELVENSINDEFADDFAFLEHTLLNQIVDLHLIYKAGKPQYGGLYGPVDSPTNSGSWFNLDLKSFLECSVLGYEMDYKNTKRDFASQNLSWRDIKELLFWGQYYE